MRELAAFARTRQQFEDAGVDIVALNVDDVDDPRSGSAKAKEALRQLDFPFQSGLASPRLVDNLDILMRGVFDRHPPLPVPMSFLVDADNRLAVVYRGPVDPAQILADLKLLGSDSH